MTDPIKADPTTDIDPELSTPLEEDRTVTAEDLERDDREPRDAELHPVGGESVTGAATMDFSLPEDDDPAQQDAQSNAAEIREVAETERDFPVSGDVTGGQRGSGGNDALAGAGMTVDDGIDPSIRTEMLDNAAAYGEDFTPNNVNDEPSFDDGMPASFSDFSLPGDPGGAPRLADPNQDSGGEVRGPRIGGSGGIDGGPPRSRPLPGTEEEPGS